MVLFQHCSLLVLSIPFFVAKANILLARYTELMHTLHSVLLCCVFVGLQRSVYIQRIPLATNVSVQVMNFLQKRFDTSGQPQ